ncbi:transcriptional regulator [Anoxybacillus rupiensis]|nr:transcriptional regulator [Anoxybacillus rupiensis]
MNEMNNQSSSTKQQLLQLLKIEKRLTAGELAKRLEVSEMAVRRHLHTLERDGLVQATLVRQAMGRPTNVYELSEKGEERFPQHYKQLTMDLLKELEHVAGAEMLERLFRARTERLKATYERDFQKKTFEQKMKRLLKLQNEQGYMAKVKRDEDGTYHLIAYHCPISEVAKEYHSVCSCEQQLFRQLLDTSEVVLRTCITKGDDMCRYQIKEQTGE